MTRLRLVGDTKTSLQPRYVELTVVPSGTGRDRGQVQHLEDTLEKLAVASEVVVITAPPVDRSSEALLWARLVDAIVLVVPLPGARRRDVASSIEAMDQAGLKPTGLILSQPVPSARLRLRRRGPAAREPGQPLPAPGGTKGILAPREDVPRSGTRSATRAIDAAGDRDA